MSSFYISAAHKSSGKTTLSIGLAAALKRQGLSIQTFKKGPDYIDPIWLSQASGNPCQNLDFFTSSHDFILNQFYQHGHAKDMVLVEGNMGLFDGISLDGSDSNAAMARLLNIPVLLVVDCSGTSRGIAPLLQGYQQFDPDIRYAGVVLNKVAGGRHESKLRAMVETYTDFRILGAVPRNHDVQLTERHLGLIPSNEIEDESAKIIALLADQASQHIDIEALKTVQSAPIFLPNREQNAASSTADIGLRIAIAQDKAFGFYYPGDLEHFRCLGVELVTFNALEDAALPDNIDGLFIGGGFPETQINALSANTSLLDNIRQHIENGLPAYAECGGLMYLCEGLTQDGQYYPLANVIPARVTMHQKPQGRGYVILQPNDEHPWYSAQTSAQEQIKAHEFHYSALQGLPDHLDYAYAIKRGTGIDGVNDGIMIHNLLASYTHLRRTDTCAWVDDFVSFVKSCKE